MSKPMKQGFFECYYEQGTCMCFEPKGHNSAMCHGCRLALAENNAALLHDIENGTGGPLLIAMGEFRDLVRRAQ